MTQQDRELLLKDLCARLPYGVKIQVFRTSMENESLSDEVLSYLSKDGNLMEVEGEILSHIKPYLRPMSSMTEEEKRICYGAALPIDYCSGGSLYGTDDTEGLLQYFDFLNEHHFDYRGLIEKGLALEAPERMYNK